MHDISKLLEKKESGDIKVAARILGISPNHVSKILTRPTSKRYAAVVDAIVKVIQTRENLIHNG